MNTCVIELRGEVKNLIRFMVENVSFVYVDNGGIHFTTDIQFGNIVKELDEDAMKELYGVPVSTPVKFMTVEIHKNEPEYYDEECDCYVDGSDDNRPWDLYKFKIQNYSSNIMDRNGFGIEKEFIQGNYFKPHTYEHNKREFINNFFKEFSDLHCKYSKEDARKLRDWGHIEFEVPVFDVPVVITEAWRNEYQLATTVTYSDEDRIVEYYRFPEASDGVKLHEIKPEGDDMLLYTNKLLQHNWANVHTMLDNLCNMLYEMKDMLPFDIDLEPAEKGYNKYKYNKFYGDISNLVYSLARNDKQQLAKIYVTLGNTYDKLIGNKEA